MALQPVDLVVAATAARIETAHGQWRPTDVQRALHLPWATLDRSLHRLRKATVLRDQTLNRIALASLLPALRYLFPLEIDESCVERGVPTGYASAAFDGKIRYAVAQVWPDPAGSALGHPVLPLHPNVPAVASQNPDLGAVFTLLDAVRGGRAREVGIAAEKLRVLLDLPLPYAGAS